MAFLFASAPPPTYTHAPAHPLTPAHALAEIETYLDAATDAPHLHPDCRFNERGPTLEGRAAGGLILHQLGRVAKGLKGERLVAEEVDAVVNGTEETATGADGEQGGGMERVMGSIEEGGYEGMREHGEARVIEGEVGEGGDALGNEGEVEEAPVVEKEVVDAEVGRKRKRRSSDEEQEEEDDDDREARKRARKRRREERRREESEALDKEEEQRRKREKQARREERRKMKMKHVESPAEETTVGENELPNGTSNHVNGVSSPSQTQFSDLQRKEKLEAKARKEEKKRARKAKDDQFQTNGIHEQEPSSQASAFKFKGLPLNGSKTESQSQVTSPVKTPKHRKKNKKIKAERISPESL